MILHRRLSEVDGVLRFGRSWMILKNTKKPEDLRKKRIEHKKVAQLLMQLWPKMQAHCQDIKWYTILC